MKAFFTAVYTCLVLLALNAAGCGNNQAKEKAGAGYVQQNITVLLDLSDRVAPADHPEQAQKDTAAVLAVLRALKQSVAAKGTFNSQDRMHVTFYPQPPLAGIAGAARKLAFNLGAAEPAEKKQWYAGIEDSFAAGLAAIYACAASTSNTYRGSDIFSFIKNRAAEECFQPGCLNTLVIVTDGYLYWRYGQMNNGNRYNFIGPEAQHVARFRGNPGWQQEFRRQGYGLLSAGVSLAGLRVLVLEVNPVEQHPEDFDIMQAYWEGWMRDAGVEGQNFRFIRTDLPHITAESIKKYFLLPE